MDMTEVAGTRRDYHTWCIVMAVVCGLLCGAVSGADPESTVVAFESGSARFPWFVSANDSKYIHELEWKRVTGPQSFTTLMLLRSGVLKKHPNYTDRLSRSKVNGSDVGMILSDLTQQDTGDGHLYLLKVTYKVGDDHSLKNMNAELKVVKPADGLSLIAAHCKMTIKDKDVTITSSGYPIIVDRGAVEGSLVWSLTCDRNEIPPSNIKLTVGQNKDEEKTCNQTTSCSLEVTAEEAEALKINNMKFELKFGVDLKFPQKFGEIEIKPSVKPWEIALTTYAVIVLVCLLLFLIATCGLLAVSTIQHMKHDKWLILLFVLSIFIPIFWPFVMWRIYHCKKGVDVPRWYWGLVGFSILTLMLLWPVAFFLLVCVILKPQKEKACKDPSSFTMATPKDNVNANAENREGSHLMEKPAPVAV